VNAKRRPQKTRDRLCSERGGLTVLEFSVLIVAIIIGLAAVHVYVRRAVQGKWRSSADRISMGLQYQTAEDGAPATTVIKH